MERASAGREGHKQGHESKPSYQDASGAHLCISTSSFSVLSSSSPCGVLTLSPADGSLGGFHLWAVMNNAADVCV